MRLNLDGADFERNIGKAKGQLGDLGGMSSRTETALSHMAAKGFGAVIPGAENFTTELGRGIAQMTKATGWLGLLGQAAIIAGGALLVAAGVQALEHWIKTGEAIWKVKENLEKLKKAAEDETAVIEKRNTLTRGMQVELATATGDDMKVIALAEQARRAEITKTFAFGLQRNKGLLDSDKITAAQRSALYEKLHEEGLKRIEEERAKQEKAWLDETTVLLEQYKTRKAARDQFEASLGAGATPGSSLAGIRKALDLQKELDKGLRDIAGAERLGLLNPRQAAEDRESLRQRISAMGGVIREEFSKIPNVVDLVQTTLNKVDTGQFGDEIEKARDWAAKFVKTDKELNEELGKIINRLTNEVPPAVDRASQEYKKLGEEANALAWQLYGVNVQLQTQVVLLGKRSSARNTGITDAGDSGDVDRTLADQVARGRMPQTVDALSRLVTRRALRR